jgi:hypothetical protein
MRAASIHKLGNLTLLTTKLNPSVGNREWEHKKNEIRRHSLMRLTTSSVLSVPPGVTEFDYASCTEEWNEERIRVRGELLTDLALEVWASSPETRMDTLPTPTADASHPATAEPAEETNPSDATSAMASVSVPESSLTRGTTQEVGGDKSTTQMVTQADLDAGQIRVPSRSKHHFPADQAQLNVIVEDVELTATWDPRMGPDRERSGVLRFGAANLQGLVFLGTPLRITQSDGSPLLTASVERA